MTDLNQDRVPGSANQGFKEVQGGAFGIGKTTRVYENLEGMPSQTPGRRHRFWNEA